jgi:hypothetical protein
VVRRAPGEFEVDGPDESRRLTVPRNQALLILLGVCILSAGVATATTLLVAEEGPEGRQGAQGARGPHGKPGPEGPEGSVNTDELGIGSLESEVEELSGRLDESEEYEEELESNLSNLESTVSGLCRELEAFC